MAEPSQPDPNPETHESKDLNRSLHRLTIKHLMFWLLSVSIALVEKLVTRKSQGRAFLYTARQKPEQTEGKSSAMCLIVSLMVQPVCWLRGCSSVQALARRIG